MLYYTAGTIEYCNGTSFTTFSAGGLNNVDVELAAGTAAAPSLSFFADTATGIYQPAIHTMAISTNGTERVAFDASGNLNLIAAGGAYEIASTPVLVIPAADPTGASLAVGSGALTNDSNTGGGTNGESNTAVGYDALNANGIGHFNVAVGSNALQYANPSYSNVAVGSGAMTGVSATPLTSGSNTAVGTVSMEFAEAGATENVAVGYGTLAGNWGPVTGSYNTALGAWALQQMATASDNTAVGFDALTTATSGTNTAVGYSALNYLSTGNANTAVGNNAMVGVSATPLTGSSNTAVGDSALLAIQGAAQQNTALGTSALRNDTTSSYNTAVGNQALYTVTTGATGSNTAVGDSAGYYISTGGGNVAVGNNAISGNGGASNITTNDNTAVGYQSMQVAIDGAANNTAEGYDSLGGLTSGTANVAVGYQAGLALTTGTDNTAIGFDSLLSETTGSPNTAVGYQAGKYITTGTANTALGTNAMVGVAATPLTGADNTAVGDSALFAIQGATGFNTATGFRALYTVTTGTANTAFGENALNTTTGNDSTAVGGAALQGATTGTNSALGFNAGKYISTGTTNTALGGLAMQGVAATPLTGNNNTGVGDSALLAIQGAAAGNAAVGQAALTALTTGTDNTAEGASALAAITTGTNSTAVGYSALLSATGSPNDALGYNAGKYITTGTQNVAIGYEAMQGVAATPLTGTGNNEALGYQALLAIQGAAAGNTAVGQVAGDTVTTGTNNVFLGYNAQAKAATDTNEIVIGAGTTGNGSNTVTFPTLPGSGIPGIYFGPTATVVYPLGDVTNIAIGDAETKAATVSARYIVAIGSTACEYCSDNLTGGDGAYSVAIGYGALQGVSATAIGQSNTAVGYLALNANQGNAGYNTALGYVAGGNTLTTGADNVFIGAGTDANASGDTNEIVIGYNATGMGSNSILLGNSSITHIYAHVTTITSSSDRRLKKDIEDTDLGLDFIDKLRPVSFRYNNGDDTLRYGFIAQDVEQALPPALHAMVEKSDPAHGLAMVERTHDKDRTYGMGYSELLSPLVKSVQQLKSAADNEQQHIRQQQQKIALDNQEIADLKKEIALMQQQIRILAAPHPPFVDLPATSP